MQDDLSSQIPYIIRVCEVHNVPVINLPGYEADDVIGTFAVQAAARKLQTVIVSNDKDMCQLVRDPLVVCMRSNSQNVKRKEPVPPIEWCDEAWVENKFGVPPAQIIDLLGLMGDAVDNIPGAPGIGAKGAVQIVKEFGSIEEALKRADEIKHKTYRESLKNNADIINQSRELATIKTDAPITLDLEKLKHRPPDRAAAYKLFRELEFKHLTREYSDAAHAVETEASNTERRYRIVRTADDLNDLVRKLWDTEHWSFYVADPPAPPDAPSSTATRKRKKASPATDEGQDASVEIAPASPSTANGNPSGIAISTGARSAAFIDLENFEPSDREAGLATLRDVFGNGLLSKSVHDLKRAVALLERFDIEIEGVADDTLLAAYLLDPTRSRYDLYDLSREATGADQSEVSGAWPEAAWRAAEMADLTNQTADVLHGRVLEQGLEMIYNEIELPLAPLLHRIERAGLRVDTSVLKDLSDYFGAELEKLTAQIYKTAGREFKITSPKQVGEVLEELNISRGRKTSTGQISTSRDVLDDLAKTYELPRLIIEYRELDKLKTVYTDALPELIAEDGRIHSQLNQTVTATGRLSSSNPNLQNIPIRTELGRRIRRAFVPEKGNKFVAADYSQLELRLLAHVRATPKCSMRFRRATTFTRAPRDSSSRQRPQKN